MNITNPLADAPGIRKAVYVLFWLAGLVLGATQVGFATADAGTPDALKVALGVYAFLGGAIGFTASQNTPENGELDEEDLEELPENDDDLLF